MNREEIIGIFNSAINGNTISFTDKIIPLISQYLTDINYEKSSELISFIVNNPQLATQCMKVIIDYYTKELNICSVLDSNKRTILYY